MWKDALFAYLHFAAIFALIWFLAKQWTLLNAGADRLDLPRLARADMGFGLSAGAVLAAGALRLVFGVKPLAFYLHNPVFHTKMALFVLVAVISIWPTRAFVRWRKAATADANFRVDEGEWRRIKRILMIEMHLIALIPLLAVLMARGIGYRG
jgi:putative membrane protein